MKKTFAAALLVAVLGACASMGGAPMPAKFEGGLLVNSAGMTLYTFDKDAAGSGKSTCNGPCDGSKQWAHKGKPVYLWIKDQKPGDKTGDGVNKVWHVIAQ